MNILKLNAVIPVVSPGDLQAGNHNWNKPNVKAYLLYKKNIWLWQQTADRTSMKSLRKSFNVKNVKSSVFLVLFVGVVALRTTT